MKNRTRCVVLFATIIGCLILGYGLTQKNPPADNAPKAGSSVGAAAVPGTPIFTPAVIAKFKQMAGPPPHQLWADLIQGQVDDAAGATVYGDMGLGALIKYQIDPSTNKLYATQTANILTASMHDGINDRNWIRGYFGQAAITTFLIKDSIDPSLLATLKGQLQTICNTCMGVNTPDYAGGFRITDTDQTIGQFFGLMVCAQCFPDITFPAVSGGGGNEVHTLGGLDSTAADDTTVRNAIRRLVEMSRGGEWLVSSGYNVSDDTFLLEFMWLSLKQITGEDHFPEILAWMKEWIWLLAHDMTPDHKDFFHWGDDQTANSVGYWDRMVAIAMARHCLMEAGETTLAAYAQFLWNEMFAQYGDVYPNRINPQVVLWLDPYAPALDYRTAIPRTVDCSAGVGQVTRHEGWGANDLAMFAFSPNNLGVDHQTAFVGTLQIYDRGQWALANPIGYGSVDNALPLNCPLYGGYSTFNLFGSIPAVDGDNYLLTGGYTSGFPGWTGQYNPPPSFAPAQNVRLHFWLPAKNAVVVLDRFNLDDPRKWDATVLSQYAKSFTDTINSAALKQVMWHAPTPTPTTSPTGASWNLADNSPVRLDCISSAGSLAVAVDDESPNAAGVTIFGGANVWNAANGKCSRIRFMSDRPGAESVLSVFQWGAVQIAPVLNVGANTIVCGLGDTEVAFSLDGSMPVRTPVIGVTDYLIGTDAAGKWNVTAQAPGATPAPTPAPAPASTILFPMALSAGTVISNEYDFAPNTALQATLQLTAADLADPNNQIRLSIEILQGDPDDEGAIWARHSSQVWTGGPAATAPQISIKTWKRPGTLRVVSALSKGETIQVSIAPGE